MIRAERVTKVFGPHPESVLPLIEQGKGKEEIQTETGHIVGVSNASFEVARGEIFVIMGLSGSGKSTLIRCVNRLFEPTAGKIFLGDTEYGEKEITSLSTEELRQLRKYQMSMVFQHFALFPHRTVLSNVVYGLEIQGRDRSEQEELGREVLEMVGLGAWGDAYPSALSGGMQQRVGLARGLATQAKVLLMDEPFSALDPLIKVNMQQELVKIQGELERTILFITHDLDEAMRIGDHIAIMEAGEIVQIGSPEQILVNPRTEYVANFVEHADPTSVISAGTIALPFDESYFERLGDSEGIYYFKRIGDTLNLQFGLNREYRLKKVIAGGQEVNIESWQNVADRITEGLERRDDSLVVCPQNAVLRDILRCRSYSYLPVVVSDESGTVIGVIYESELIAAILEKKGVTERENKGVVENRSDAGSVSPHGA